MRIITDFPASFGVSLDLATSAPNTPSFRFWADDLARKAPVEVLVTTDGRGAWRGDFYGPRDGLDLLATTPNPHQLLAVAGGVPYWIPVDAPEGFMVLPLQPVRSVHCSLDRDLIILAGYSSLLAVDGLGQVVWRSNNLASDGFAEVRLASSVVVTRGFYAPEDREVETTVDLRNGTTLSRVCRWT